MDARKRVLNPQVLLEFICYTAFAALMFHLVSSGRYQSYVTPRMVPYLYFTSAVMAVWALSGLFRLFRPQHKTRAAHCFVLAIPILLLLLPHAPISTSALTSGYISGNALAGFAGQGSSGAFKAQPPSTGSGFKASAGAQTDSGVQDEGEDASVDLAGGTNGTDSSDIYAEDTPSDSGAYSTWDTAESDTVTGTQDNEQADSLPDPQESEQTDEQGASAEDEYAADLPGLDTENKTITVRDEDFALWLSEIFTELDKYEGYRISIKGFVFKDPETMNGNEFVPARLAMSCCVADLAPCGFICRYDKASELKEDTWITVEGVIHIGKYMDEDEPQITVTKITPAEKVEEYIYPF